MNLKVAIAVGTAALMATAAGALALRDTARMPPSDEVPEPVADTPSPSPSPSPSASTPPHPVSIEALAQRELQGADLTVGRVIERTATHTRYSISYRSGDLMISGVMNLPHGDGPFPVAIMNHGYIDPAVYWNGRGLLREHNYLSARGFLVVHPDYRNHAQSSKDPASDKNLRLGYVEDVLDLVEALKASTLPIDHERIGMFGHSMGGGVTMGVLVAKPDLVGAAVMLAPVSSDQVDNFDKWIRGGSSRRQLADQIIAEFGSPEENPGFWEAASPRTYFDRIRAPILIHHGTADESVPLAWSEETVAALKNAGKRAELRVWPGEPHEFIKGHARMMEETRRFFLAEL